MKFDPTRIKCLFYYFELLRTFPRRPSGGDGGTCNTLHAVARVAIDVEVHRSKAWDPVGGCG